MALIQCKKCGGTVSDKAQNCPHCGNDLKKILCEECGTEIKENEKVCSNCGCPVQIEETVEETSIGTKVNIEPTVEEKKKGKNIFAIIGVVIIVLILIIVGFGGGSESETEKTSKPENTVEQTENTNETNETSTTKETNDCQAVMLYKNVIQAAFAEGGLDFEIPKKAINFINEHPDFFPGSDNNKGAISDYENTELRYYHISKNPSKYGDELIYVEGYVVDIEEIENEGKYITLVELVDYDDNHYCMLYLGEMPNLYKDSFMLGYALPFDIQTYENMNNTYTEALFCGLCYYDHALA